MLTPGLRVTRSSHALVCFFYVSVLSHKDVKRVWDETVGRQIISTNELDNRMEFQSLTTITVQEKKNLLGVI